MNKVLLAGRLTRDPEMRALASGKHVTQFSVATTEYAGNGKERPEFHNIVTWDRLAEVCGRYLGKGQQVAIEGRIQTRTWDDEKSLRHWKTEIVATTVEMLSGRKKKDYAAESSADAIEAAAGADAAGASDAPAVPADEPIPEELAA
jgi:single-strand DNA-binding protein